MQKLTLLVAFVTVLFCSCKKDTTEPTVIDNWTWTIQYANNPAYNSTPQSTGINEILSFNTNGTYSLSQNNSIINSGTYKISSAKNTNGETVASILYTNSRVTDSVAYFELRNNKSTLVVSYDLIGTVGSGARHYNRQ
jgi:hypothetical protein